MLSAERAQVQFKCSILSLFPFVSMGLIIGIRVIRLVSKKRIETNQMCCRRESVLKFKHGDGKWKS